MSLKDPTEHETDATDPRLQRSASLSKVPLTPRTPDSEMAAPPQRKLAGLMAATFTPLSAQGEINLAVIEPYIEYLVEKQGVRSVFVNGTTGESLSLSVEERKKLAEEWCQRGKGKLDQVIVHVGCLSLKESQELAQHAADTGADGIAVISPCFFKPVEKDSLRQFLQQVAAVAPQLPFYYYHIPGLTGVHLKAMDILQDIEESIPSFQGLKFSGSDLMDFGQCVHHSPPHWPMLYGMDEQLLAALVMGAHGAVGSTYNYMGCVVNRLLAAFERGDYMQARNIQFQTQEVISYAVKQGFDMAVNKQLMCEVSRLPLGPPRLPLQQCPPERAQSIARRLHEVLGGD
ncbi:N-acetylneuraminate lyase isoform X2 [Amia ocellicauda]|uniref:N-acetylneuraminate lyase isoform X2 n=1 Tax=Amia ocellicauda TaxID=2972642 RepID=UPI003463B962